MKFQSCSSSFFFSDSFLWCITQKVYGACKKILKVTVPIFFIFLFVINTVQKLWSRCSSTSWVMSCWKHALNLCILLWWGLLMMSKVEFTLGRSQLCFKFWPLCFLAMTVPVGTLYYVHVELIIYLKFQCWICGIRGLDVLRMQKMWKVCRSQCMAFSV